MRVSLGGSCSYHVSRVGGYVGWVGENSSLRDIKRLLERALNQQERVPFTAGLWKQSSELHKALVSHLVENGRPRCLHPVLPRFKKRLKNERISSRPQARYIHGITVNMQVRDARSNPYDMRYNTALSRRHGSHERAVLHSWCMHTLPS